MREPPTSIRFRKKRGGGRYLFTESPKWKFNSKMSAPISVVPCYLPGGERIVFVERPSKASAGISNDKNIMYILMTTKTACIFWIYIFILYVYIYIRLNENQSWDSEQTHVSMWRPLPPMGLIISTPSRWSFTKNSCLKKPNPLKSCVFFPVVIIPLWISGWALNFANTGMLFKAAPQRNVYGTTFSVTERNRSVKPKTAACRQNRPPREAIVFKQWAFIPI